MYYQVYQDRSHQWRWRLKAANNRIIADSGEAYVNKNDCLYAIGLVKQSKDAPVHDA